MHDKIVGVLHELERQQDFKVLFAAESGSRAWGFASPDSDYDVRMIYVKPEAWYWSLDARQPDTFNAMLREHCHTEERRRTEPSRFPKKIANEDRMQFCKFIHRLHLKNGRNHIQY